MTTPGEMWFQRSFPASAGGNSTRRMLSLVPLVVLIAANHESRNTIIPHLSHT